MDSIFITYIPCILCQREWPDTLLKSGICVTCESKKSQGYKALRRMIRPVRKIYAFEIL